jgi:hypothetical protein
VRRLFKPRTWPAWALFIWSVFGFMSTFQFVVNAGRWLWSLLPPVIPWLSTTSGRAFLFIAGVSWLSAVAWGPSDTESAHNPEKLNGIDIRILQLLASRMRGYRVEEISALLEISEQRAQHHIARLLGTGNAYRTFDEKGFTAFEITADGRDTLAGLGLLF